MLQKALHMLHHDYESEMTSERMKILIRNSELGNTRIYSGKQLGNTLGNNLEKSVGKCLGNSVGKHLGNSLRNSLGNTWETACRTAYAPA